MAVYSCHTDLMIGPTTFGSLMTVGSVPCACAETTSFAAFAWSATLPFMALFQPASVGSAMNAGFPS